MATIETKLKTPRVPNFILHDVGDSQTDIADLPDAVLNQIAQEWHQDLILNAQKRRASRWPAPDDGRA